MARIEDVPLFKDLTTLTLGRVEQSVSGRCLTIAGSNDGNRVYLGNNAGVWRSDNGGVNWKHMERPPRPKAGTTSVPGALLALNVYDLAVSAAKPDIVLAATGNDSIRAADPGGIYRSIDGGNNWKLVRSCKVTGQIFAAPDNAAVFFAACGSALVKSVDSGATWSPLLLAPGGGQVWHVVVGGGPDATRRIYALGDHMQFSTDGGATWNTDLGCPMQGSQPADHSGSSARILAIHPTNSQIVYATHLEAGVGIVWRGDYSGGGTPAVWTKSVLPRTPQNQNPPQHTIGTGPSGNNYICTHVIGDHLYLFASDREYVYVTVGDSPANWQPLPPFDRTLHGDPHAILVSPDFHKADDGGAKGRIWQVNDGGVFLSTDGGQAWEGAQVLSSHSLINVAVRASRGSEPSICFGTGDNGGFFSRDGGQKWITADYSQGDNDACFVDPRQPSLLYVFAPRGDNHGGLISGPPRQIANGQLILYIASANNPMDAGDGSHQRLVIPGPLRRSDDSLGWNCVSSATEIGYRPLILTLPGQTPRPGGDFITIRYAPDGAWLLRTTALATLGMVSAPTDWDTTDTSEGLGVKVFRQGPVLPNEKMSIVQASDGHNRPIFYVGDTVGLWKWTNGMSDWQALVPFTGSAPAIGPDAAIRFYVDPYRSDRIYLIDKHHVWRSPDGGASWVIDAPLQDALTEHGAIPMSLDPELRGDTTGRTPFEALLQDLVYDPTDAKSMIAVGPAGIFSTSDGTRWDTVALCSALNTRVMSTFMDAVSSAPARTLYVPTPFRGLLRIRLDAGAAGVLSAVGFASARALQFDVFRTTPL